MREIIAAAGGPVAFLDALWACYDWDDLAVLVDACADDGSTRDDAFVLACTAVSLCVRTKDDAVKSLDVLTAVLETTLVFNLAESGRKEAIDIVESLAR